MEDMKGTNIDKQRETFQHIFKKERVKFGSNR